VRAGAADPLLDRVEVAGEECLRGDLELEQDGVGGGLRRQRVEGGLQGVARVVTAEQVVDLRGGDGDARAQRHEIVG